MKFDWQHSTARCFILNSVQFCFFQVAVVLRHLKGNSFLFVTFFFKKLSTNFRSFAIIFFMANLSNNPPPDNGNGPSKKDDYTSLSSPKEIELRAEVAELRRRKKLIEELLPDESAIIQRISFALDTFELDQAFGHPLVTQVLAELVDFPSENYLLIEDDLERFELLTKKIAERLIKIAHGEEAITSTFKEVVPNCDVTKIALLLRDKKINIDQAFAALTSPIFYRRVTEQADSA
ncbi:MAG: hypothetical protein D6780_06155 [Candidatus Dadabacteria bacterium]|nr:MAG: hypothetical protein D6780_06155 [Candidatus Dadabacteria bacterium]